MKESKISWCSSGKQAEREGSGADLLRVLVSPTVNAVVRDVQSTLREPLDVARRERTSRNGRVGAVPAFRRGRGNKGEKGQLAVSFVGEEVEGRERTSRGAPWPSIGSIARIERGGQPPIARNGSRDLQTVLKLSGSSKRPAAAPPSYSYSSSHG